MRLFAVTKRSLCQGDFLRQIERLANSGVAAIILREKDLLQADYLQLAQQCQLRLQTTEVPLIINQHVEIARQLEIKMIQLSFPVFAQQWQSLQDFRQVLVSVHTLPEAVQAEQWGAHGLIAGHIFPTDCKRSMMPRGLAFLQQVCFAVQLPVYAIGGITAETIASIEKSQAAGACVMSQAMQEKFFWMPH